MSSPRRRGPPFYLSRRGDSRLRGHDNRENMTILEQHILDTIQDAFPLEERPYKALAESLGSDEQTVFKIVEKLRRSGIVRRIGGVYDSKKLGYTSRLCAGKVPAVENGARDDSALAQFAETVNGIPAITHNYVRSHEYNVWFTVIGESENVICKIVDEVCSKTQLHDVHILRATQKFKINTVMKKNVEIATCSAQSTETCHPECSVAKSKDLSQSDRTRIHIACGDIPHTLTPYADWGISVEELRNDLLQKRMRRFGAILRHQDAGFAYNAMVCFDSAEGGDILASNPHVSHCYERPVFDGFPYSLYAMMHAQSAEDLDCYIRDAARSIGGPDYVVLNYLRELKKTSFRFF